MLVTDLMFTNRRARIETFAEQQKYLFLNYDQTVHKY